MLELNEVFDEDKLDLPVTNLYPKTKIPQIFAIGEIDQGTTPAFRMCTYTSGGDTNKNIKPGDKMAHVIMLSLSEKGSLIKMKNLGPDPIGTISTVFNIVYSSMRQYKIDAVLFRITKSKIGGQARQLQIIMDRLVRSRTGGKYVILKELWDYDKKYAYILIHRKNIDLSTVPGVPEISTDEFKKVDTAVGEVYIDVKTGNQVSKNTAIAASIAKENDTRSVQSVISRAKISRRQVAMSQSLETERFEGPDFEHYEATAAEFSKPATAKIIPESKEILNAISSKASKAVSTLKATGEIIYHVSKIVGKTFTNFEREEENIQKELLKRIGDDNLTSVKSMQACVQTMLDRLEENKHNFIAAQIKSAPHGLSALEKQEHAERAWNIQRVKVIKELLQGYARTVSSSIRDITMYRTPKQYTKEERQGIREYVGSGYSDINNMLLGRYTIDNYDTLTEKEVKKAISSLDKAFLKGDRLPEGITVWRSQTIRKPIYEALVKNKVFYFRNYVSTSLAPIIFGGWKGNQGVAFTSDATRNVLNIDGGIEGVKLDNFETKMDPVKQERIKVNVGWAIDGAHKINVIYPGDLSNMASEMEIILPRGTMVQINKITDASYNDGLEYSNQKFIQAEVMTSEQLSECTVVYDGDHLMETGEVIEYSDGATERGELGAGLIDFGNFVKSAKISEETSVLSLLASCIDLEDTPNRFVD
ncbi:Alt-like RNA polymerase ADP-ribosyltransferase [Salmonella phage vB_SnwM_CGG4-1]|uniref:NAD(+)--arginine ADP-ribosyltransferase n=1 Tax=Salmonella phage vB_SnwM_CGG4-1 TaxID=1815631 RepID=A0A1B0VVD9_9CAUD|nr:Alt-like RNA polymerase ADP-ribosyltransferase [Salmonella phage vB_SnwM_CGG4-1]ANA49540.1 ADP-ribosyltransferase [Salmonella phage vB_SnwM_CGG4-1]